MLASVGSGVGALWRWGRLCGDVRASPPWAGEWPAAGASPEVGAVPSLWPSLWQLGAGSAPFMEEHFQP